MRPQSRYGREWLFDYEANLMTSCNGGTTPDNRSEPVDPRQIHCGPSKGDWFDEAATVSPLDEDCDHLFRFTWDGQVIASPDSTRRQAAKETIKHLNPNSERLLNRRDEVINGLFGSPEEDGTYGHLSDSELLSLITGFNERDAEGRYRKFCVTIIDLARQLLET
jgi:uncharacterized protein (TIGR02646 family)